ncbi:15696_t:CDS:2 [Entrophospora sp. SA101]|nr:1477_t:CDS:2 [Entrophospora sp. SA101]CAJ0627967.1 15696_t:CDS:2 [Entrophospora sp. SA101]CAJ0834943.1 1817_t:CDS:2 [Entrophospora sp. SA101]CAJ0844781.1 15437_t:CDS:2 [Entrophospora sp. SA101]
MNSFGSSSHSAAGANSQGPKVPKTLYCYGCQKDKQIHSFSKTQVTKAMSNIENPYAPRGKTTKKHHTMCKQCTPQQNENLTCMICTREKPLSEFAKAQRKNAEKARCIKCVDKHKDEDIDDSEPSESDPEVEQNETWDDIL